MVIISMLLSHKSLNIWKKNCFPNRSYLKLCLNPINRMLQFSSLHKKNDDYTHFGYQTVNENEKEKKIHEVFERVAEKYDIMNDIMSVGLHRYWKNVFINRMAPTPGCKYLDVAGGTGDIAFRILQYLERETTVRNEIHEPVTVIDINSSMLTVGQARAEKLGLRDQIIWREGNAENLPFPDGMFDCYSISFGIRNVTHISKALEEAFRVLKLGGQFMCLEFGSVTCIPFKWLYDQYSFKIIPVMGTIVAGDWHSYQYLVESIRKFPPQDEFANMIKEAGFSFVSYENLTNGIAAIHSGFKINI